MKRLLALLVATLILLSFAACTTEAPQSDATDKGSQNESASDTNTPDNTDDTNVSGDNANDDANNDVSTDTGNTDKEPATNEEITFTEIEAVNNAECSIKITGIDEDNFWGYTLKVQLENKSSDKNYMFSVESASINGVQCSPLFANEVAPGKKANEEIVFMDTFLDEIDIGSYDDIKLTFRVYDNDDWLSDAVAHETVHVYPYGKDKGVRFARAPLVTDTVIFDNEYVTAIVTGYENDTLWGYSLNLFLINKTDKDVMFTADDVSVNGFMLDPFFSSTVYAGNCEFTSMTWFESTLEENSITEIEEIEFSFRAYDFDDWFSDDFANETVKLNP